MPELIRVSMVSAKMFWISSRDSGAGDQQFDGVAAYIDNGDFLDGWHGLNIEYCTQEVEL